MLMLVDVGRLEPIGNTLGKFTFSTHKVNARTIGRSMDQLENQSCAFLPFFSCGWTGPDVFSLMPSCIFYNQVFI